MFGRNNTISEIYSKINVMRLWYGRIHDHITKWLRGNGGKYDHLRKYVPLSIMIFLYMSSFLFPASASAVSTAERQNIWVAYTVGDVSFIHSVLRAISMIMYGGGGVIQGAYRLAALLGIIWLIVRGIFCKEGINIGSGLFVIIFYMCFFVPQSTLHIEDLQTKKFYVMDKIPLGVSVTLSVTSKIGKYLSEAYETVFTEASEDSAACTIGSMECNGYLGTLDMLLYSRSNLQNAAAYIAINKALCGSSLNYEDCNIEMSLTNYVRDCTMQKVISPSENFALQNVKSFKGDNTKYDLFYDSERTRVNVYLGRLGKGSMTCKKAGLQIEQAFLNSRVKSTIYWLATHKKNMTPHDGGMVNDGGTGVDNGMPEGNYDYAAMEGNFQSMITGLDPQMGDSYTYLKNVMIQPLMENGLRNGFIDQNIAAGQIALDNAKAQRDIQLAAESSMFASMIRPLTTFFEGFVLAITPLMPFLLLLSLNTFGLVMKYLLVLFWIQLWAPALAICNMYIQNIAREDIAMAVAGGDLTSMVGITRSATVVQHWLGVGGMMAASVPILTLFILTGSVYAFTNLAASIKGGDHFDEKAIQPDAIKRTPYMSTSAGAITSNTGAGVIGVGTEDSYATLSASQISQTSESAAHSEAIAKQNQYIESVINGMLKNTNSAHNKSIIDNIAKAWKKTDIDGYQKMITEVKAWAQGEGVTLTNAEAAHLGIQGLLNAKVGASGSIKAGVHAKVGTPGEAFIGSGASTTFDAEAQVSGSHDAALSANKTKDYSDTEKHDILDTISKKMNDQLNGTEGHSLENSLANSMSSMNQDSLTIGFNKSDAYNTQKAYNENKMAEDRYSKIKTNASSFNSTMSFKSNELAQLVTSNAEKNEKLSQWKAIHKNSDLSKRIQSLHGAGKANNPTGATAALIEYAVFNQDEKEAKELLQILQLDDYLGKGSTARANSANTIKFNPTPNAIRVEGKEIASSVNQDIDRTGTSVTNTQTSAQNTAQSEKTAAEKTISGNNKGMRTKFDEKYEDEAVYIANSNIGLGTTAEDRQTKNNPEKAPTPLSGDIPKSNQPPKKIDLKDFTKDLSEYDKDLQYFADQEREKLDPPNPESKT